jgi:hypothetical protein
VGIDLDDDDDDDVRGGVVDEVRAGLMADGDVVLVEEVSSSFFLSFFLSFFYLVFRRRGISFRVLGGPSTSYELTDLRRRFLPLLSRPGLSHVQIRSFLDQSGQEGIVARGSCRNERRHRGGGMEKETPRRSPTVRPVPDTGSGGMAPDDRLPR